jgi:hypothetical protein
MSQESVDWIRQVGEAGDQRDLEAVEALMEGHLAPEFAFQPLYLDRV